MAAIAADGHTGDQRMIMDILLVDFCCCDIEILVQRRQQRLEMASFLLQGGATSDMNFDDERGKVHWVESTSITRKNQFRCTSKL